MNKLVDTGRKYDMELNIKKSLMRVSKKNELMQIKVDNKELDEVGHFKHVESVSHIYDRGESDNDFGISDGIRI